jgi:hypothetical protein
MLTLIVTGAVRAMTGIAETAVLPIRCRHSTAG